ncbi:NAD-dependent epimerase/dehydratase family protein [bacterium]|nr:NAD-dependent epimerase/dehydratase family protein [candidate division CSSED10-310 bacterium]
MRILVIGGTRFIGPQVVKLLCQDNHEVAVFHRGKTPGDLPKCVKHILGNRAHLMDFRDTFTSFNPDAVLDMFLSIRQDAMLLMKAIKGITRRLIVISSQDVYRAYGVMIGLESASIEPVPLKETAPLRTKLYPYRTSIFKNDDDPMKWLDNYDKIPVESITSSNPDIPATILRLPMVYGPGDSQHRMFEYLKRMDDGRPCILIGESMAGWRWSRGYVVNVAHAIARAIVNPAASNRIYNVAEKKTLTIKEWVELIGETAGWNGKVIPVPDQILPESMKAHINTRQDLVSDTTRIREELDYDEPIPIHEAVQRTIEWERLHPPNTYEPSQFDYTQEDQIINQVSKHKSAD